jgi:sec-independent protein translocase protein TatB
MGFGEILVIAVLGLLVIGPDKLPEYIRSGAKMFNQFRSSATKARDDLVESAGLKGLDLSMNDLNPKKIAADVLKEKPKAVNPAKNYQDDAT